MPGKPPPALREYFLARCMHGKYTAALQPPSNDEVRDVQVVVCRISACSADEKCVRICCGTVAALTFIETF